MRQHLPRPALATPQSIMAKPGMDAGRRVIARGHVHRDTVKDQGSKGTHPMTPVKTTDVIQFNKQNLQYARYKIKLESMKTNILALEKLAILRSIVGEKKNPGQEY